MEQERPANRTLYILLTIAVSIYLLEKLGSAAAALSNVLLLLALAWLLAFTLRPAVEWLYNGVVPGRVVEWIRRRSGERAADLLDRLRLPYGLAVVVVYLLLFAGLFFGGLALVPVVSDQIGQLLDSVQRIDVSSSFDRVVEWVESTRRTLIENFRIDPAAIPLPEDLIRQFGAFITGVVTGLGQFLLDLLTGTVTFVSQVVLVLLISIYVMIDGRALTTELLGLLPNRFMRDALLTSATIDRTFGGFIRGTLLQAFVYGAGVTALMLAFGLEFAVVIGVATGVLMLIPYVGGLIGLALPLLAGLLQSSPYTVLIILILFGFQIILFNLIMPRIMSESLRMPTLLVFVALIVGGQLLGVWGLLFAVPVAGALYSIGVALLRRAKFEEQHTPDEQASEHG